MSMQKVIGARRCRGLVPMAIILSVGALLGEGFIGATKGAGRSLGTARSFFGAPTGSERPIPDAPAPGAKHYITGNTMYPPWPAGLEVAMFGMGCFWCSENLYMKMPGVYSSQVGYAGGQIPNPSYRDVCSGQTGHNEVVRVVFDPKVVSYVDLLKVFWERHNPTTLNRQGNDMGTQYRSGIYYYSDSQREIAEKTKAAYQEAIGGRTIVTEIVPAPEFFYAEDYHQQYDAKPGARGYCGLQPLGVTFDATGIQSETTAA